MEQEQTCEHCGGRVTYDADAAGARANCPHCSHEITLGNPTLAARPSVRQTGLAAEGEIASNRRSRPMVWASVCGFVILCAIIAGTVSYLSKKGAALPMTGKSESASVPEKPTTPAQEESAPPKQSEEPSLAPVKNEPAPLASGSKPGMSAAPSVDTVSVPTPPMVGGVMLAGQSSVPLPVPPTPGGTPKVEPKPFSRASAILRSLTQTSSIRML